MVPIKAFIARFTGLLGQKACKIFKNDGYVVIATSTKDLILPTLMSSGLFKHPILIIRICGG